MIQRQLLETPADDFATRHALRAAQDHLRAEAAVLRGARPLSDEEHSRLEQRRTVLRRRRDERFGDRLPARQTTASTGAGTGAETMNGAALMAVDQAILAAGGRDDPRHEIAVLEQRLSAS